MTTYLPKNGNEMPSSSSRLTLATVWLDGCSGCHMSMLDMDEYLLEILNRADLVYSPLVDRKDFPNMVDITLVEGAVSSVHDLEKIMHIREHTRVLVSLGDCAVTGNVPSMRNLFSTADVLKRAYVETSDVNATPPTVMIPKLLARVRPVHQVVPVDVVVPGCPPSAQIIAYVLDRLIAGEPVDLGENARFG